MNKIEALINKLESNIPQQEMINPMVSKASVGWHIEHSLLTINQIIKALKNSNPGNYKWTFSFIRILVFATGKFQRGRAQSPKSVLPKNDFNAETLQHHIYLSKEKLAELDHLKPGNYFEHPYFGKLNLKPAIRFIEIHTSHHIDIINDIINK